MFNRKFVRTETESAALTSLSTGTPSAWQSKKSAEISGEDTQAEVIPY
jgi:hypothetical protein